MSEEEPTFAEMFRTMQNEIAELTKRVTQLETKHLSREEAQGITDMVEQELSRRLHMQGVYRTHL